MAQGEEVVVVLYAGGSPPGTTGEWVDGIFINPETETWMRIASWCRFDELMGVVFVGKGDSPSSLCKDLKTFEVNHKVRVFFCVRKTTRDFFSSDVALA